MATTQQKMEDPKGPKRIEMEGGVGSPVSNDCYNLIACLHEKLQGLEAMRKFSKDADEHIWKQVGQLDLQAVDLLLSELERLAKDGKLRECLTGLVPKPAARS